MIWGIQRWFALCFLELIIWEGSRQSSSRYSVLWASTPIVVWMIRFFYLFFICHILRNICSIWTYFTKLIKLSILWKVLTWFLFFLQCKISLQEVHLLNKVLYQTFRQRQLIKKQEKEKVCFTSTFHYKNKRSLLHS